MTVTKTPANQTAGTPAQIAGFVSGAPRLMLRLEGAILLVAASTVYAHIAANWLLFAALFLVPDLSMLGYLRHRTLGASVYNLGHSYLAPSGLIAVGLALTYPLVLAIGLIWIAHIGFDRMVGYGLKYRTAFSHTHLGQPRWSARAA